MQTTMECPRCGAKFYSSAWHVMLEEGERCDCGAELRETQMVDAPVPTRPNIFPAATR